jgi:hypothetical protein
VQVSPVAASVPLPVVDVESVKVLIANVACTDCAEFIVMLHVPVPVHAPVHPVNVLDTSGTAVNCTVVPEPNDDDAVEQPIKQLIPDGDDVTFPVPVPSLLNVNA